MMLHYIKTVLVNIRRFEWYVCFWSYWFSRPTALSTVVTFFQYPYASVCSFDAFVWCSLFSNFSV